MSARRILVTGGTGFIGSALVQARWCARARRCVSSTTIRVVAPRRLAEVAQRHRAGAGRHPRRGGGRGRHARHRGGASPRLCQRHRDLLQRARSRARRRRQGHGQRHRRLPAPGRGPAGARVELGSLPVAAARADRRERAAGRSRPAQPAALLRRRQDHQRDHGDQLRPQVFRARADLPAAQCLRPRHGLRSCHSAICGAPQARHRRASGAARCRFRSKAAARKRAASVTSTISSPASW